MLKTLVCKVNNHMPENTSQAPERNSVAARGTAASPTRSLVHIFPITEMLQAMPQPKEQNRFFPLEVLKSEQENSLTPKQQKVPDYRKMMLLLMCVVKHCSLYRPVASLVLPKTKKGINI